MQFLDPFFSYSRHHNIVHSSYCNLASNYDRNKSVHHFKANILLYHIVSKPQYLNLRLMPHLVVGGHIYVNTGVTLEKFLSQRTQIRRQRQEIVEFTHYPLQNIELGGQVILNSKSFYF